jgi:hypothetical protein
VFNYALPSGFCLKFLVCTIQLNDKYNARAGRDVLLNSLQVNGPLITPISSF